MTPKDMFIEQVKYISQITLATQNRSNKQTLHHAYCVDDACLAQSSGQIFVQANEFVELLNDRAEQKTVADPKWLKYSKTP